MMGTYVARVRTSALWGGIHSYGNTGNRKRVKGDTRRQKVNMTKNGK